MLAAAAEVSARGLAKVVLLGDPLTVEGEAKKAGADISGCSIVDPQVWAAGRAGAGAGGSGALLD